jgi:hypothetical protein
MHAYPLAVLRRQMRDIRSPAGLGHIERGTLHESAFVTRADPPFCTDVSLVVIKTQLSISGRCARQQQMGRNR